jgi:tetratricopeptide (TPR) repeat protein
MAKKDNDKSPEVVSVFDFLKKLGIFLLGLVTFITSLVNFLSLWHGNRSTVNLIVALIGSSAIIVGLGYISFKKIKLPKNRFRYRYQRYYRHARYALAGMIMLLLLAGISYYQRYQEIEKKVIILVASFDGPNPQVHRVTEILYSKLKKTFTEDKDIMVISISDVITDETKAEKFATLERKYQPDFLIWGWYGVTSSDVIMQVNIKNFNAMLYSPIDMDNGSSYQVAVSELDEFTFQQKLSDELISLFVFVRAIGLFEAGDTNGAIQQLNIALNGSHWPENFVTRSQALLMRGIFHVFNGNNPYAIEDFTAVLESEPDNYVALFNRGFALQAEKRHKQCVEDLNQLLSSNTDKAIELRSKESISNIYNALGICYFEVGQFDNAVASYLKAIEASPTFPLPHNNLGNAYTMLGQLDTAINEYDRAIALKNDYALAYFNRGSTYARLSNYPKALDDLDKAIQLNPKLSRAFRTRGFVYWSMGEETKAIESYTEAIHLDTNYELAYLQRGDLLTHMGYFRLAIADYSEVIRINPSNYEAIYDRATLLNEEGYHQQAIDDLNQIVNKVDDSDLKMKIVDTIKKIQSIAE